MKYRPKDFEIRELVAPEIYEARGERAWELLNPLSLMSVQSLRDELGPIVINTWHVGGSFKESGLRLPGSETGAKFSMHKYGGAFDCKFKNCTAREAYEYVLANPQAFPHITTVEDIEFTPTWLHIDGRNHNRNGIWIVKP